MKTKYRIPNTNTMKYELDEKYKNSMKTKYQTVNEQTRSTSIEKKLDEKYQLIEKNTGIKPAMQILSIWRKTDHQQNNQISTQK